MGVLKKISKGFAILSAVIISIILLVALSGWLTYYTHGSTKGNFIGRLEALIQDDGHYSRSMSIQSKSYNPKNGEFIFFNGRDQRTYTATISSYRDTHGSEELAVAMLGSLGSPRLHFEKYFDTYLCFKTDISTKRFGFGKLTETCLEVGSID